jgi:hypothetical protein
VPRAEQVHPRLVFGRDMIAVELAADEQGDAEPHHGQTPKARAVLADTTRAQFAESSRKVEEVAAIAARLARR